MSDSLIQRIRTHLIDERIHNRVEANAEIDLMTNVELVEVISFVLEDILAKRPTWSPLQERRCRQEFRARHRGNRHRSQRHFRPQPAAGSQLPHRP